MMSETDLAPVNEYKAALGGVLSVYLDFDQSNAENLNRRFEAVFESKIKELRKTLEDNDRLDFDGCAAEARKVLAACKPRARGLVIFARATGLIWLRELHVPVAQPALVSEHWKNSTCLTPLPASLAVAASEYGSGDVALT